MKFAETPFPRQLSKTNDRIINFLTARSKADWRQHVNFLLKLWVWLCCHMYTPRFLQVALMSKANIFPLLLLVRSVFCANDLTSFSQADLWWWCIDYTRKNNPYCVNAKYCWPLPWWCSFLYSFYFPGSSSGLTNVLNLPALQGNRKLLCAFQKSIWVKLIEFSSKACWQKRPGSCPRTSKVL